MFIVNVSIIYTEKKVKRDKVLFIWEEGQEGRGVRNKEAKGQ